MTAETRLTRADCIRAARPLQSTTEDTEHTEKGIKRQYCSAHLLPIGPMGRGRAFFRIFEIFLLRQARFLRTVFFSC